eukprot:365844-Chlamydomonas_euryale.AAC.9
MSSVRRKLKGKRPPEGWELIEEVVEDFESQMKGKSILSRALTTSQRLRSCMAACHIPATPCRCWPTTTQAVNEDHEGKRKAELPWKIHRLHWEKNRFLFDLMYQRKVMSRDLVG